MNGNSTFVNENSTFVNENFAFVNKNSTFVNENSACELKVCYRANLNLSGILPLLSKKNSHFL